ncbi:MAG: flagellar hook-associated protein 3 [Gammaproteobacteria bacterium]|nr:flagellar hook-associated protein 3 [Gammaproteobacteria bacterium]
MTARISTYMLSQRAVNAMLERQSNASDTQLHISSGKRIMTPSDDPAGAARVISYTREIETLEQYEINANRATTRLGLEETALVGTENILQRVRELTVQGGSDLLTPQNRQAIAAEIWELRGELIGLANTRDSQGEYIFAGYQTGTQPFEELVGGAVDYNGDLGGRKLQISRTRQIADGNNGYDVFMDVDTTTGKSSMFDTLSQIASDLDSDLNVGGHLDDIDLALNKALEVHATIGARMNAIDEQVMVNGDMKLVMEISRSEEEDIDFAQAITDFNQQMTALEAAQQTYMKISELSLFNFLR